MPNKSPRSPSPSLSPEQARALTRLASSAPDDAVRLRARIVSSWAAGESSEATARELNTSRRTVSKWRARFRDGGVEALWDLPRPGAPRTISQRKIAELLRLKQSPPPAGKPRWTTRMLAQETGLSQSTVARMTAGETAKETN